ncbi:H-NS histone family protein [Marinomonas agarivorans]|nr:H-NS histone family protein [Marinomonas agarivorans]
MSFLLELAGNKAKARAAAKELTIDQLENIIAGFSSALEKLKTEAEEKAKQEQEKTRKAEELAKLIAQSGLTLEEIADLSSAKTTATKSKSVEPKYRLVVDGEEHLWTGRGRTPKVFQTYFDAGNTKESCAI